MSSDIPLYKIRNDHLKSFLKKYIDIDLPSETTLKSTVSSLYELTMNNVKSAMKNQYLWMSMDETTDASGRYVANVVIGVLFNDEQVAKQNF